MAVVALLSGNNVLVQARNASEEYVSKILRHASSCVLGYDPTSSVADLCF